MRFYTHQNTRPYSCRCLPLHGMSGAFQLGYGSYTDENSSYASHGGSYGDYNNSWTMIGNASYYNGSATNSTVNAAESDAVIVERS